MAEIRTQVTVDFEARCAVCGCFLSDEIDISTDDYNLTTMDIPPCANCLQNAVDAAFKLGKEISSSEEYLAGYNKGCEDAIKERKKNE